MNLAAWIYIAVLVIGAILFSAYSRTGKLWRCIFVTAFSGAGALGLVWLLGKVIALKLAITPLTLLLSMLLGVPGVIAMLVMNLM